MTVRCSPASAPAAQQRLPSGSQLTEEEDDSPSQTASADVDVLAAVVGPYSPTPALACPVRLMHTGQEWLPVQGGGQSWTKEPKADHFFDTFTGTGDDQRGHFVVRCRVCALEGATTTYLLSGGKSSNAWKHFDLVAGSRLSSGIQRSRHAAVATYRAAANDAPKAAGRASGGPISGYLTVSRNRVMSPVQARPHHVRFVLMLVMTLSPFAMSGNAYLLEFVRGLGVPYTTPSPSGVRDVLLDVFLCIYDRLRDEVRQLQGRYRGLPFFHLVTDLWTERHGSGSYGSLVLRCFNPDGFVMRELYLGVTPFSGRHDHETIKKWLLQQLARFGVRPQDISSSTTDSGSNVKKALRQLWPRWIPCGAHAIHLAVKAALGATGESAAARDARSDAATTPRTGSRNPAASELLGRTRKTTTHFHKSPASVAMLNAVPLSGDDCVRKLLTECPTRWGSTYLSLARRFTLMPRLIGFGKLRNLTAAQERRCIARGDWEPVRHLIGVLQPSYKASTAVQSASATVAEVFELVCRLQRTMQVTSYPCPTDYSEPLSVGRDAILAFLDADKGGTDVMELEGRLYEHEQVYVKRTRNAPTLCPEAATYVSVLQDELEKRFFNKTDTTKNWLMNDAVLAATLVTPGGGSMLKKVSTREGQDDAMDRAHAAVRSTSSHLLEDHPAPPSRRGELEGERKKCRTSLIGWDSEESRGACDDTPAEQAMQELDRFLNTSVPADYYGALGFWAARRDDYPLLHLVACSLLGASGSSARQSATSPSLVLYCARTGQRC